MIAKRSGSLNCPQAAISGRVLPQPTQRPLAPLTAHTLMQGLDALGVIERNLSAKPRASQRQILIIDKFRGIGPERVCVQTVAARHL